MTTSPDDAISTPPEGSAPTQGVGAQPEASASPAAQPAPEALASPSVEPAPEAPTDAAQPETSPGASEEGESTEVAEPGFRTVVSKPI